MDQGLFTILFVGRCTKCKELPPFPSIGIIVPDGVYQNNEYHHLKCEKPSVVIEGKKKSTVQTLTIGNILGNDQELSSYDLLAYSLLGLTVDFNLNATKHHITLDVIKQLSFGNSVKASKLWKSIQKDTAEFDDEQILNYLCCKDLSEIEAFVGKQQTTTTKAVSTTTTTANREAKPVRVYKLPIQQQSVKYKIIRKGEASDNKIL